jgi:inner membrane protein
MDPLTQATLGAALAQSAARPERVRAFSAAGAIGGLAPDLDIFIRSATDPLLYLEYHRQFTHSLVFIPVGAALCALLVHPFVRARLEWRETWLACLLGYATHGLLDACTSYGTQLFWPFSDFRVGWNWISVVDPLFSVPLFGLLFIGFIRRRPGLARLGLCWAVVYLAIGALQQARVETTAMEVTLARGHEPVRLTAKPGFGNLLVWKVVYEHDGRYYVDAVRAGLPETVCPGEHIEKLRLPEQLSWLEQGSQQWLDVERFRWYADDWLALDRQDPNYVVDVRYAALPNRIDALWGLKLDPAAHLERHAVYHVVRSRRSESLDGLLDLLLGRGCEPP